MAHARVGRPGTPTRLWARRGSRLRAVRDSRHMWAYIFGAAGPAGALAAGLGMPFADTQAMNAHPAETGRAVAAVVGKAIHRIVLLPSALHAILVPDDAGWHGAGAPIMPEPFSPATLPPDAPELDPIGNVRAHLRGNKLAISVFDSSDAIVAKCCEARNILANDTEAIASIPPRSRATVSAPMSFVKSGGDTIVGHCAVAASKR